MNKQGYTFQILASIIVFLLCFNSALAKQNRIALIIGNADYTNIGPLKNPVNDANGMDKVLIKMGFRVIKGTNLTRKQMRSKIREFGEAIKSADVGLFYFAGHGLQYDGNNYLVPVKTNIEAEDEIMDEAINASSVLRKMESAGTDVNIVVLDACRNNPFKRSFRSASRGLNRMEGPKGSLIAYATAPGSVAADGEGNNGLYTEHLMKYIQEPIPLEKVFKKVRNAVSSKTSDKQIPWENSSLVGDDFYFNLDKTASISPTIIKPQLPTTGDLSIRSNVKGDSVSINGVKKGSTKLNLNLIPGVYFIEVSKKGYKTFEQSYTVVAGAEQILYAKLTKLEVKTAKSYTSANPSSIPVEKKNYSSEQQKAINLFNNM